MPNYHNYMHTRILNDIDFVIHMEFRECRYIFTVHHLHILVIEKTTVQLYWFHIIDNVYTHTQTHHFVWVVKK